MAHTADGEASISPARFRRDEAFLHLQHRAGGAAKFKLLALAFRGVPTAQRLRNNPAVAPIVTRGRWTASASDDLLTDNMLKKIA